MSSAVDVLRGDARSLEVESAVADELADSVGRGSVAVGQVAADRFVPASESSTATALIVRDLMADTSRPPDPVFSSVSMIVTGIPEAREQLLAALETEEGVEAPGTGSLVLSHLKWLGLKVCAVFMTGSMMATDAIWRRFYEEDGEIRDTLGERFGDFRRNNFMTYTALVNLISRSGSMISSTEVNLALQYFFQQATPGVSDQIHVAFQVAPSTGVREGMFPSRHIIDLLGRASTNKRVILVPFVYPSLGMFSEAHIVMYGIDQATKQVLFFDSKGTENLFTTPFFQTEGGESFSMQEELQALVEHLNQEIDDDGREWELIAVPDEAVQFDGNNCGVHIIRAIERVCERVSEGRGAFVDFIENLGLFGADILPYRSSLGSMLVGYYAGEYLSGRFNHDTATTRRLRRR